MADFVSKVINLRFHKRQGIFWLAEWILVSQERLYSSISWSQLISYKTNALTHMDNVCLTLYHLGKLKFSKTERTQRRTEYFERTDSRGS
jgi:hypothetical protein